VAGLHVTGAAELRRLARQMRGIERRAEIRKRLAAGLRTPGKEILVAVRTAAVAIPSRGESARRGRMPLGKRLARATQLQVKTSGDSAGVKLWVNPGKMPDGQRALPAYQEGEDGPWRHSAFGNSDGEWFTQSPHPFFWPTVEPRLPGFYQAAEEAIDHTADEIERG
jgi:hypothetical protein